MSSAPIGADFAGIPALVRSIESFPSLAPSGGFQMQDESGRTVHVRVHHPDPLARLGRGFSHPFRGVAEKDFWFQGKRVHLVAVDLTNPHVQVTTNTAGERGRSVLDQARAHRAEVAINGDFFTFANYEPSGLARTSGKQWAGTQGVTWEGALAWSGRDVLLTPNSNRVPASARNVVSSRPCVLRDGQVVTNYSGDPSKATPTRRTGVGISQDRKVLYLVAVESPISAADLGRLLHRSGAYQGLAMDSGGSAQLYVRGRGLVQASSDPGGQRRVSNTIMIVGKR